MVDKKKYYVIYTGLFIILSFFCFGVYLFIYNKSLLRFWDTYNQHYICFIKMGQWFRSIIRGEGLKIWDPALGYGADFYLTLSGSNSGSLFDPVNWISTFIPARFAEFGFTVTVFLRLYLCGISFSIFAFRKNKEGYAVLCGALAYTFCACAYVGMYQFSFIVPMYVFPLVIYGTDELFEKNKPVIYVITLTLSALWSYYFTYMTAVLVVSYCVIKWLCQGREEKNIKRFLPLLGRFTLFSLLAAGMAAIVLFPVVKVVSGMGRLGLGQSIPVLYDTDYYKNMLKGLIGTYDMGGRDCQIGFCLMAFLCLIGLFITKSKYKKQLKIEIALMVAALCIPFAGYVMNGFSYIANRWIWGFALAVGMAVVAMLSAFRKMSKARLIVLCGICVGYLSIVFEFCDTDISVKWLSLAVLLLAFCGLMLSVKVIREKNYRILMVVLTCLTIVLQAYYNYSDRYTNGFSNNIESKSAYEQVTRKGGLPILNRVDTTDGSRYVSNELDEDYNAGWLYNTSGINFYYSCYNEAISQFHNSIALKTSACIHCYKGLDNRSELMALMGVNHYISTANIHPTGYDILETEGEGYNGKKIQAWETEKKNSLFTRFEKSLSRTAFDNESPYDRQRILMQACVVDNEIDNVDALYLNDESISFELKNIDNTIKMYPDYFEVTEAGAQMDCFFDPVENVELYLFFDHIDLVTENVPSYSVSAWGLFDGEKEDSLYNAFSSYTKVSHLYGGKHDWLLNLGSVRNKVNGIRIRFGTPGIYTLNGIHIYARNRDDILNNILALNHEISNTSFPLNEIRLSMENTKPEYLFVAIPYSEGWKAYDRGHLVKILKADVGFMALQMEPGEHEIRFVYQTPGFITGLMISFFSMACFIVIWLYKKSKNCM